MEPRIVDLEVRYTHQERLLDELSKIVFEQSKAIAELERRLGALEKRAREEGDPTLPHEKPPHY